MQISTVLRGLGLAVCLSVATGASPISIGPYDFGPAAVTLDFLGMVPGVPVDGFYSDLGITFGPGLYMSDVPGVITNNIGLLPELPVQIDFATPQSVWQVGFEVSGSDGDLLTLTVLDEWGMTLGSLDYYIGSTFQFTGLAEPTGFRSLVIQDLSFGEGQIYIQNLQFEEVSEPSSGWMVAIGVALALAARHIRRP